MAYFKKIVGEKVFLSPINPDDAEVYTRWINDLEVGIYLTVAPNIYTLSREREILERIGKEGYNFAIVDSEKERVIGNCGLMNVDFVNRKAEMGIFIGEKNYWGKGYGTEAIELLLDFSFNILNLNSMMLTVRAFNKRAIRCYEKCGFKLIGKRREATILGPQKYDEYFMDILAAEFKGSYTLKTVEKLCQEV